eukprot:CAMPEP_0171340878 /NCGR_PEP_ID=MMETSP0878-20121228/8842_1 /TAXON_ID=67004 /ORGANISM="Thalassiosira weissflogii, Strain CCMP1336" /LENGTH=209 /DNA_ID=CAMNT_0011843001 /DNA_START=23 /DNA_END=652 /DNA_ORIENTATION=-
MTKISMSSIVLLSAQMMLTPSVESFVPSHPLSMPSVLNAVNGIWNTGNDFGKGKFRFYEDLDSFMAPFPDEDRELYPEMFKFPKGVYEVRLAKPCGIIFEEVEVGKGVFVADLVEGGNAERQGIIQKGDVLVGVTAIRIAGAKWERRILPARKFGFDMVVNAIGSNEERWGCDNVVLMVERPGEANSEEVDKFLEFFEPPADTPWKLPV